MAKRLLYILTLSLLLSAAGPAAASRHAVSDRKAGLSGYVHLLMDLAFGSIFGSRVSLFARGFLHTHGGPPCDSQSNYSETCRGGGHGR